MTTIELQALIGTVIRVERSSSTPNQRTGSYTYRLITEIKPEVVEAGLTGLYEAADGNILIYSQLRLGKQGVPFTCPFRLVAENKDRKPTGRIFLNLVDAGAEAKDDDMAAKQDTFRRASRFFVGNFEASVDLGNGVQIKMNKTAPTTVERVAATPAIGPVVKNEDPQLTAEQIAQAKAAAEAEEAELKAAEEAADKAAKAAAERRAKKQTA